MLPRWLHRSISRATLKDKAYGHLFDGGPPDEFVAIDCETTGLNVGTDDIITVAAVRIVGKRVMASEAFTAIVRPDADMRREAIRIHGVLAEDIENQSLMHKVMPELLKFIGGRPLVGYYLDFDVAMLNKHVRRLLGIRLPNEEVEISKLYYERKYGNAPPGTSIDLSFRAILADLDLPVLGQHDALNDALMTAMMFVRLRDLKVRGIRIPRPRGTDNPQSWG